MNPSPLITHVKITLNPDEILRVWKNSFSVSCGNDIAVVESLPEKLESLMRNFSGEIIPRGVTVPLPVELVRDLFVESLHPDSPIYRDIDDWKESAIFIITTDSLLDDSLRSLTLQNRFIEASLLDTAGSWMIEEAADELLKKWGKERSCGNSELIFSRYSPGHCSWESHGLSALFGYMGSTGLPVSLPEDTRMFPAKSLAGVFVLESISSADSGIGACSYCNKKCSNYRA